MRTIINWFNKLLEKDTLLQCSYPAIDIELKNNVSLHLVGSIHMGSEAMFPLPAALLEQINSADALIVESDITQTAPDMNSAEEIEYPVVKSRLSPELFALYERYRTELRQPEETLDKLPSWQIALILQSAQAYTLGLRPHYGIDYQVINAARGQNKPIIELEGIQQQLNMLLELPNNGLLLLEDTVQHWHDNARSLQIMLSWWFERQPKNKQDLLPNTFSESMYQHLMVTRNEEWKRRLNQLEPGRYVVVVGALHLYGSHNLPEILC